MVITPAHIKHILLTFIHNIYKKHLVFLYIFFFSNSKRQHFHTLNALIYLFLLLSGFNLVFFLFKNYEIYSYYVWTFISSKIICRSQQIILVVQILRFFIIYSSPNPILFVLFHWTLAASSMIISYLLLVLLKVPFNFYLVTEMSDVGEPPTKYTPPPSIAHSTSNF